MSTDEEKAGLRTWTAKKFNWLDVVNADSGIGHLCFRVAFTLSGYVNRSTGDAWPPQEQLAKRLGVTVRAVQLALSHLAATGYLLVQLGEGRGHTNHYRLALNGEPVFALPERNGEQPYEKGRTGIRERANGHSYKNTYTNTYRNTLRADETDLFEEWFRHYPRQTGKDSAKEAYEEVVAQGKATPEQLLAAAIRYADEQSVDPLGPEPTTPRLWLMRGLYSPERALYSTEPRSKAQTEPNP